MMRGRFASVRFLGKEALLALAVSLALTLLAGLAAFQQVRSVDQQRFDSEERTVVTAISRRVEDYEEVLRGGAALMEADPRLDRQTWRIIIEKLHLDAEYPGMEGIGFAQRVDAAQLQTHLQAVQADGYNDYSVTPPGDRPVYFPVVTVEPFSGHNLPLFGHDLLADPGGRLAMEGARDAAALRSNVRAPSGSPGDPASDQLELLAFMPVYDTPRQPIDLEARRRALRGFLFSRIRVRDMLRSIVHDRVRSTVDVALRLGGGTDEASVIYRSRPAEMSADAAFHATRQLEIFGAPWSVTVSCTPAFDSGSALPWVVLGSGFLVSALLALLVQSLTESRQRSADLAQANEELDAARTAADAASSAKSRFLAAASHDLRQPLQSLGLYLHLLTLRLADNEQRHLAERAVEGLEATERMLSAMMDISCLETGQMRPDVKPVKVGELVRRIAAEASPEASAKNLRMKLFIAETEVDTDLILMERLVRNLVSNALRYTRHGGVLLACRHRAGGVALEVWDTGPGIPEDKIQLIWEEFYQIDNPERDRGKGLGLGLATVSRIARLLGCTVTVHSRLGHGTVFRVDLPDRATVQAAE